MGKYKLIRIQKDGKVKISKSPSIELNNNIFSIARSRNCYVPKLDAFWWSTKEAIGILFNAEGDLYHQLALEHKTNTRVVVDNQMIWLTSDRGFYQIEIKKNLFKQFLKNQSFRGITKIDNDVYFNSALGVYKASESLSSFDTILDSGLSTLKDSENNLWVCTPLYLTKLNPKTKETKKYEFQKKEVWSLFEDKNGWIWYSHVGLNAFAPKAEQIHTVQYNEFEALKTSTVYHFSQKKDGNIWLCTTSGLYEMNLKKGIVARYWSGGEGEYYLPADDFRHFYFNEKNQTYWLAASGKGVIQWTPETQQSELFTLPHTDANVIHAVYPDDFGFLWLSTENGIVQFNKTTHEQRAYLPKDGISSHEFNRISHFQDENGTIYFGSIDGITAFHPKDFVEQIKEQVKTVVVELNQYLNKNRTFQHHASTTIQERYCACLK